MKKSEIQIGHYYVARISDHIVVVRIDRSYDAPGYTRSYQTHWSGTNMQTMREVRIRSAAKLRYEVVRNTETKKWISVANKKPQHCVLDEIPKTLNTQTR